MRIFKSTVGSNKGMFCIQIAEAGNGQREVSSTWGGDKGAMSFYGAFHGPILMRACGGTMHVLLAHKHHKMLCNYARPKSAGGKARASPLVPARIRRPTRDGKSSTGLEEGSDGVEQTGEGRTEWQQVGEAAGSGGQCTLYLLTPLSGLIRLHSDVAGTGQT